MRWKLKIKSLLTRRRRGLGIGFRPRTLDRTDITLDRTDITLDSTK